LTLDRAVAVNLLLRKAAVSDESTSRILPEASVAAAAPRQYIRTVDEVDEPNYQPLKN
jgi:hypothetical protein